MKRFEYKEDPIEEAIKSRVKQKCLHYFYVDIDNLWNQFFLISQISAILGMEIKRIHLSVYVYDFGLNKSLIVDFQRNKINYFGEPPLDEQKRQKIDKFFELYLNKINN